MEQVGNDGNEAETFRCEPRYSKLVFEFCSCFKLYKPLAQTIFFYYNKYGDIEWNIKLQLVMKEKQLK